MQQDWLHFILASSLGTMALYSVFFCYEYRDRTFLLFAGLALFPAFNIFFRHYTVDLGFKAFEPLRWSFVIVGWSLGLAYLRRLLQHEGAHPRLEFYMRAVILGNLVVCVLLGLFTPFHTFGLSLAMCLVSAIAGVFAGYALEARFKNIFPYLTFSCLVLFLATSIDWLDATAVRLAFDVSWVYAAFVMSGMFVFSLTKVLLSSSLAQQREEHRISVEHRQKMAALGEIASTIAHEVKNPLAALIYATDIQAAAMKPANINMAQVEKMNQTIEKAAKQIHKIVNSLSAVSRHPSSEQIERVNVKRLIEKTIDLFNIRLRLSRTSIQSSRISDNLYVMGRESQICQVLLNLLNNAFDAVEKHANPWIVVDAYDENDGVVIAVTDSGQGIDPALHDKIMSPFFTTKEKGRGTGLGLSICKSILTQHEGKIRVVESPNTRFEVWLPSPNYFK